MFIFHDVFAAAVLYNLRSLDETGINKFGI